MGIVRRQSIKSSFLIYLGFGIGAFNVLILYTHFLSPEQIGLLQLMLSVTVLLSSMATLGTVPVINKFFPFYNEYLSPSGNDLPFLALLICFWGFVLFVGSSMIFKGLIIRKFGGNSPMFLHYFYLLYPLIFFLLLYSLLEAFGWGLKMAVLTSFLRETLVRLYATILILLVAFRVLNFDGFIKFYSFLFLIPSLVLLLALIRSRRFSFHPRVSKVTKRLGWKMAGFGGFVFGGGVFNLLSKSVEVFFISSINGLAQTGVYSIGDYVIRFLEVPQRSMSAVTIPLLAQHWKNREYSKINELYKKSAATLLIFGFFFFGIIWSNIDNLVSFLPRGFLGIKWIVLILGIGKLVDLGTGINNQIIQTSSFWKFDFFSNVFFTSLSIPMNYFLIHKFGMIGAALTVSISLSFFNLVRFVFIYMKFNFQPFNLKILWTVIIAAGSYLLCRMIPFVLNIYMDTLIRSLAFGSVFGMGALMAGLSEDVNQLWNRLIGRLSFRN